jgi:peptidoglycan hydrolase-like protein with peptidoglycan-binding domain
VVAGVAVALTAGAAPAVVAATRDDGRTAGAGGAPAAPAATGRVERGTLRATVRVDGHLGRLDERALLGGRPGTVTTAPEEGRTYRRGDAVYAVDLRPVPLLYGRVPLFRPLAVGSRGADVRELEANLVALGHGGGLTPDDRYTAATAAAVRRWQRALGVTRTGTVQPGDAVVATDAVRVSSPSVSAGQRVAPGTPVATVTSTRHGVWIDLEAARTAYAVVGAPVTVTLPTGGRLAGTVTRVGSAATGSSSGASSGSSSGAGAAGDARVRVEVTLSRQDAAGRLDSTPVDVDLVAEERRGVLSVPVEALLATSGGGFAVTVVGDGPAAARRQVSVRTGLFAGGRVEVTGALTPGDRVEVPAL